MPKTKNALTYISILSAICAVVVAMTFYFNHQGLNGQDWRLYPHNRQAIKIANTLLEVAQEVLPSTTPKIFYQVMSLDLNDNGHYEHLILMNHPYYCGSGGCTLFIYDAQDQQIQKITGIHAPISIKSQHFGSYPQLFGWSKAQLRRFTPAANTPTQIYTENASTAETLKQLPQDALILIPSL